MPADEPATLVIPPHSDLPYNKFVWLPLAGFKPNFW
jgi:hypothetical protein